MLTIMATQVVNGKGFEWAVASACSDLLGLKIELSPEQRYAKECFLSLSDEKQTHFRRCAERAVEYVVNTEMPTVGAPGLVTLAGDDAGVTGDVRDVLLSIGGKAVGFSCKTNHEAFKHSRLSSTIDFVQKWGLGVGCSQDYWQQVRPVFEELKGIKEDSKGSMKWSEIPNYQQRYYIPVLLAWREELLRVAGGTSGANKKAASALCHYIIGRIDFWKVIATASEVRLYAFNINRTLGTNTTKLPDRIVNIDSIDGSEYSMTVHMNNGFQFNFRIHNASSRVEPSLKFDVQAEGLPTQQVHQHTISVKS